jgi:hypothetical protein
MLYNYIEDLLDYIGKLPADQKNLILPQDRGILFSISKQLSRSLSLTEKQADLVIRIVKNTEFLYSSSDVKHVVDNPRFRNPFRIIDKTRIVEIVKKDQKNCISIRYPFDITLTKALNDSGIKRDFDTASKAHLASLNLYNLIKIIEVCKKFDFIIDPKIEDWLSNVESIKGSPIDFVPTLMYNDTFSVSNSGKLLQDYFDTYKTDNNIHDLFLGKILNLHLSDEAKNVLSSINCESLTKKIIQNAMKNSFYISSKSSFNLFNITAFLQDVKNWPVTISLNDTDETTTLLTQWLIALNKNNIMNHEISFLYRSPKNKSLNEMIREKSINNLVSADTKVVFINHKVPKTLYKINYKSNILIVNGDVFGHYTMQKLVDTSPVVLYYYADRIPRFLGSKAIEL